MFGPVKKSRLCVMVSDPRGKLLLKRGRPLQMRSFRVWNKMCQQGPWDLILDIGANYGEMIHYSNLKSQQRIICVEPNRQLVDHLKHNLQQYANAEVMNIAVGPKRGNGYLLPGFNHSGTAYISSDPSDNPTEIFPLDEIVKNKPIKRLLVKIDIEGGEYEVLKNTQVCQDYLTTFFAESNTFSLIQTKELLKKFDIFDIDSNIRPIYRICEDNVESWIDNPGRGMNALLVYRNNKDTNLEIKNLRMWTIFFLECIASILHKINIRS